MTPSPALKTISPSSPESRFRYGRKSGRCGAGWRGGRRGRRAARAPPRRSGRTSPSRFRLRRRALSRRARDRQALRWPARAGGWSSVELDGVERVADVWPRARASATSRRPPLRREPGVRRPRATPLADGDEVALIPPVCGGAFRLSGEPLDLGARAREVGDRRAGAVATFVGTMAGSRGRRSCFLEYEAFAEMAEPMLARARRRAEAASTGSARWRSTTASAASRSASRASPSPYRRPTARPPSRPARRRSTR